MTKKKKKPQVPRERLPTVFLLQGERSGVSVFWGERGKFHASAQQVGESWRWVWVIGEEKREGFAPTLSLCAELIKASVEVFEKRLRGALSEIEAFVPGATKQ